MSIRSSFGALDFIYLRLPSISFSVFVLLWSTCQRTFIYDIFLLLFSSNLPGSTSRWPRPWPRPTKPLPRLLPSRSILLLLPRLLHPSAVPSISRTSPSSASTASSQATSRLAARTVKSPPLRLARPLPRCKRLFLFWILFSFFEDYFFRFFFRFRRPFPFVSLFKKKKTIYFSYTYLSIFDAFFTYCSFIFSISNDLNHRVLVFLAFRQFYNGLNLWVHSFLSFIYHYILFFPFFYEALHLVFYIVLSVQDFLIMCFPLSLLSFSVSPTVFFKTSFFLP